MKRLCIIVLFTGSLFGLAANETTITLRSDSPVPFYVIESLAIDPVSRSLINDYDIYYKSMELVAISPATFSVENGDYVFAISDRMYNRAIPIKARGENIVISIRPSSPRSKYILAGAALALAGSMLSAQNLQIDSEVTPLSDPWFYVATSSALLGVGGIVWWLSLLPRVEVE